MSGASKPKSLRQAMTQMHTWLGLGMGWMLFLIFVMGALAYYRQEITVWMQPETHSARYSEQGLERAVELLELEGATSTQWSISLPSERVPYYTIAWQDPDAPALPHMRVGMRSIAMDPETGDELVLRQTSGGAFLYRIHVQLFAFERATGRAIIAFATMVMLLALISGLFVHRTIFKDFFTFRPGRGKLSWRDAHNATAVLSYPFHIVISLSGLLLFGGALLSPVLDVHYAGNPRGLATAMRGTPPAALDASKAYGSGGAARPSADKPVKAAAPETVAVELADIRPMLLEAQKQWAHGAATITVNNPLKPGSRIEIRKAKVDSLANGGAAERLIFDGVSGELLDKPAKNTLSPVMKIWQTLVILHRGHFAGPFARFMLFASGLCGAGMVASGLVMWSISRKKQLDIMGRTPLSCRLVESLSIAAIPGMFVAIGCYFAGSRFIPAELAWRIDLEKNVFFTIWILCLAHALLRGNKKKAWIEQFVTAGTLLVLLPAMNALTGGAHLGVSLANGLWAIAGFDVLALLMGAAFLLVARKIIRHAQLEDGKSVTYARLEPALSSIDARSRQ